MIKGKKILLVGPLNAAGVGGRLEEMKVWANALTLADCEVSVFSMFNANPYFGSIPVYESLDILTPFSSKSLLGKLALRIWGSKPFKRHRDNFYLSRKWESFSTRFDHIILFITDSSRERLIFESSSQTSVLIRFTGTIFDFTNLKRDAGLSSLPYRKYVFHDPALLFDYSPAISTHFVDQTAIEEEKLLQIPITSSLATFAMIGLFMEVKQVEEVILKFAQVPDLKLLIFGQGELESVYKKLIAQNKLSNVEIRGFYPSSQMDQMYSQFDALIINSTEETGPMTGVEAMAAGKIILSKRVGAMAGRLADEQLLVDANNSLENTIQSLVKAEKDTITEIRTRLRNRYIESYSNESISNKIAQVTLN
ncbi:glycosyltransferase family 4 protein [Algoriphagus aquimarinus]|uniref:Glycosyltransferase n=1 Tax=Algoriphagus aquimarinus TaxID=237018 RepID=A0A5C7AKA7_9BACT|nr:glycosyltransferase [Algoriphagus aquimarinus]TXE08777.1 glycosyltransferase [Algoriphagus aquimarinus]